MAESIDVFFPHQAEYPGQHFAFEMLHDKSAVCMLLAAADQPVQLLATASLRTMLRKRLGPLDPLSPATKQADLRPLIRKVAWLNVNSRFEADLHYIRLARRYFPLQHAELLRQLEVYFVAVDPAAAFPRFSRVALSDLGKAANATVAIFGPMQTKAAADKWIEQVESAFDLCRYHQILASAPRGQPCAYKDMGRCPAPCDGTISMPAYRQQVQLAVTQISQREAFISEQTSRMTEAAGNMAFESAARIKQYIDEITALFAPAGSRPGSRFVRPLSNFRYLVVRRGSASTKAKLFEVTPWSIGLLPEWDLKQSALPPLLSKEPAPVDRSAIAADELAIFCQHLFEPATKAPGRAGGSILHIPDEVNDATIGEITAACQSLTRKPATLKPEPASDAVDRELSSTDFT